MTTDANLIRCGNCGETWEEHSGVHCDECRDTYYHCPQTFDGPNDCSSHASDVQFREETEADRQAQWAGARGL